MRRVGPAKRTVLRDRPPFPRGAAHVDVWIPLEGEEGGSSTGGSSGGIVMGGGSVGAGVGACGLAERSEGQRHEQPHLGVRIGSQLGKRRRRWHGGGERGEPVQPLERQQPHHLVRRLEEASELGGQLRREGGLPEEFDERLERCEARSKLALTCSTIKSNIAPYTALIKASHAFPASSIKSNC